MSCIVKSLPCSQAMSLSPSLSSYPAEFRSAADYDRNPCDKYLLHHWNHIKTHYYCDECGTLVTTAGGIKYHGMSTFSASTPVREGIFTTLENPTYTKTAVTPLILLPRALRLGGAHKLYNTVSSRRKRPTLIHTSSIHRFEGGRSAGKQRYPSAC